MRYPDELVNEIISANDLVDVASSYITLKRSGRDYKGLCPFHGEKTPSFHISADKQLYYCFGCHAGGSVLQFIMNIENLDYTEALQFLADRARIILPEKTDKNEDITFKRRSTILKINTAAAKFFYNMLKSEQGAAAQQYFAKRGLSGKTVSSFGLGFAPDSFTACTDHLRSLGFSDEEILDSNMARKSEKTGRLYDFFRNRVMFPIIDVKGNVVAFGGRVLDDSKPKYLNSSDSLVFNKSKTLFALNFAKKTCSERIILCEGYMDVIALHKSGFTNAVATLGTALTREHAALLSRYTSEVLLCYDSDGAGQKATNLALEIFKAVGMRVKVIKMPGAKDPDEFIKAKGAEAFEKLIGKSQNAVLYKINKLTQEYNSEDVDEKIKLVGEMAKVFAEVSNQIEQDILIKETATKFGISVDAIYAQVRQEKREYIKNEQKQVFMKTRNMSQINECELVLLMAYDKTVFEAFKDRATPDFFKTEACKAFVEKLFEQKKDSISVDPTVIITNMTPEYAAIMSAAITDEKFYENPLKAAEDIYAKLTDSSAINVKDINDSEELQKMFERLKSEKH